MRQERKIIVIKVHIDIGIILYIWFTLITGSLFLEYMASSPPNPKSFAQTGH